MPTARVIPAVAHVEFEYVPGEYVPGEYVPGEYVPGEYVPGEYVPGEYVPGEYVPGEYAPGEHAPGEHAPGEYAPGEPRRATTPFRMRNPIAARGHPKARPAHADAACPGALALLLRREPGESVAGLRQLAAEDA